MRGLIAISLACVLGLAAAAPAAAQDAEALRRELEQMRTQLESAQRQYQQAIETLSQRLQRLEQQTPAPAAQAPAPTPPAPTVTDYLRPRPPFALTERTGRGQLLFDLGVVADFVGNLTQRNVDKANSGTFFGRENRLFPREIELLLFGQIDPYARGEVRIEAAEEFEDNQRKTEVGLAEAHLTLLTLPFGLQAKLGQMRNRFGLLNQGHREALPQPDAPNVLARFLGEEGLVERGVELTLIPDLPFYLEPLVGIFNGDNGTAFGRASLRAPLVTGRLRTFFEPGDTSAIQLGVSGATGETAAKRSSTLLGADLKYKLVPEGWRHPLLTLAGEVLSARRKLDVTGDPNQDTIDTGETRTRQRMGWYAYGEIQPWKRWVGGVRYDSTQFPINPGREWAVEPYVGFMPSDFLRFRLAGKHTDRSHRDGFNANGASARVVDEILFQATFFLGAHTPHPF